MSILATAPSGGRRKGPGGRWEVYASGQGWVPEESLSLDELAKLSEAPRAPQSAQEPRQEPKAGKEPTARQREVWAAVVRHDGDQQAAADEAWLKDRRADAEEADEVHRDGYARGFAVATLRALAATDGLPEQLRDMASDAADGLMA